jgi:hypothetical protein
MPPKIQMKIEEIMFVNLDLFISRVVSSKEVYDLDDRTIPRDT